MAAIAPSSWCSILISLLITNYIANAANDLSVCEAPTPTLPSFVDALTFPPLIHISPFRQLLTLGAFKITQKLHRDLPNTTLYAYGISQATATYPGPTLVGQVGVPAYIRWENHIPDESHFLGTDNAIPWANPSRGGVPVVTHLHGGQVESSSDGNPDAWYTSRNETGPAYEKQDYTYANAQRASSLWYHDHTQGITRLNLMAGLMGFYILRESTTTADCRNVDGEKKQQQQQLQQQQQMPLGLPLLIRDWRFLPNGSLNFPMYVNVSNTTKWCAEYGDTMLVNGKVAPFLRVLPQQYRFHLLNGCNARFLELTLSNPTLSFLQIGTDGGLLPDSSRRLTCLLFSPGERLDILIDFSALEDGAEILVINTAPAPFPVGKLAYSTNGTFHVMKFIVDFTEGTRDGLCPPQTHIRFSPPAPMTSFHDQLPAVNLTRSLTMRSFQGIHGEPNHLLLDNRSWSDPVSQFPFVGSTEIWELINLGLDAHNMHVHLISFQILNQQSFSVTSYENGTCAFDLPYPNPASCFTDYPRVPDKGYGQGWKDTIIAWPGNVTRLLLRFAAIDGSSFPFDPTIGPGYLWHCHTGDHEDYEMMRPFKLRFPSTLLPVATLSLTPSSSIDGVGKYSWDRATQSQIDR